MVGANSEDLSGPTCPVIERSLQEMCRQAMNDIVAAAFNKMMLSLNVPSLIPLSLRHETGSKHVCDVGPHESPGHKHGQQPPPS